MTTQVMAMKLTLACSSFHLSASRSFTRSCHFARSSTMMTSSTWNRETFCVLRISVAYSLSFCPYIKIHILFNDCRAFFATSGLRIQSMHESWPINIKLTSVYYKASSVTQGWMNLCAVGKMNPVL